jgi:hypothetical protein
MQDVGQVKTRISRQRFWRREGKKERRACSSACCPHKRKEREPVERVRQAPESLEEKKLAGCGLRRPQPISSPSALNILEISNSHRALQRAPFHTGALSVESVAPRRRLVVGCSTASNRISTSLFQTARSHSSTPQSEESLREVVVVVVYPTRVGSGTYNYTCKLSSRRVFSQTRISRMSPILVHCFPSRRPPSSTPQGTRHISR